MIFIIQKLQNFLFARTNLNWTILISLFFIVLAISSNINYKKKSKNMMKRLSKTDPNSFSTPDQVILKHIDFNWNIDFSNQILNGIANLQFNVIVKEIEQIFLDVRDIQIEDVSVAEAKGLDKFPLNYYITDEIVDIGSKLVIDLPTKTSGTVNIIITYKTSPKAAALQWLTPEQTLGKKHPYLFSQCQAINARSLIPCQDTPYVKFTYYGIVEHDVQLTALLSGVRVKSENGKTEYEQAVPIPSYLLAIAVGAIVSRPLGPISKVWAEEQIVDAAAKEFADTKDMLTTASDICGPYVWKTYDLLVMPPSFPFGGMENPCLTFVTPTIIAGDKSLADVVAHEIAHSWTGNLVTNENFEHFWLNEGFTVFVEGKIVGRMKGDLERDFHAIRNTAELEDCLKNQLANQPELTKLVVDLSNVGPEEAFSSVPYIKGQTFLRYIEELVGGPSKFEPFLKSYLKQYKFKSINTNDFKKSLYEYFDDTDADKLAQIDWDLWLYGVGMPPYIPKYNTTLADVAHKHVKLWSNSKIDDIAKSPMLKELLSSLQIIELLSNLVINDNIVALNSPWINLLEKTYKINETNNAEIRFRFLRLCIKAREHARFNEILQFANSNFRMKYVRPIYRDLGNWPEVRAATIDNFNKVKDQMMFMCASGIMKDLQI